MWWGLLKICVLVSLFFEVHVVSFSSFFGTNTNQHQRFPFSLNAWCSVLYSPPEMRQIALRRPVSVSSISMGRSWLAKVNTKSVSGPKPALCICVRLRVSPSEKVMVSWSGVYLVQMRRIWQRSKQGRNCERFTAGRFLMKCKFKGDLFCSLSDCIFILRLHVISFISQFVQ